MASVPRFYVYVLVRPNGKPFYVGKGTRNRMYKHDTEARKGCECRKCRVIRKIWRNGGEIVRYTVIATDDEQEAFAAERETIAFFGRENLCNLTDGGEGTSGRVVSEKVRQRFVNYWKGRPRPPVSAETRARLSMAHKGHKRSLGRKATEETRRKMSEAKKGKFTGTRHNHSVDKEAEVRRIEKVRAARKSEEARQKTREQALARWNNPEWKAWMLETQRKKREARKNTP